MDDFSRRPRPPRVYLRTSLKLLKRPARSGVEGRGGWIRSKAPGSHVGPRRGCHNLNRQALDCDRSNVPIEHCGSAERISDRLPPSEKRVREPFPLSAHHRRWGCSIETADLGRISANTRSTSTRVWGGVSPRIAQENESGWQRFALNLKSTWSDSRHASAFSLCSDNFRKREQRSRCRASAAIRRRERSDAGL